MSFRLNYQAPGDNLSTWGTVLNTGVFQLIEDALAGSATLAVSGPVTLSSANGATDQARCLALVCTGSGGAITAPGVKKLYLVDANAASGPVILTTGSGRTATVAAGARGWVYCADGVNFDLVVDSAALAAAKAYTDATAFAMVSGNLPGQTGAAGKVLKTDGATPSWVQLQISDVVALAAQLAALQSSAAANQIQARRRAISYAQMF